jgi:mRNA-degrading endonuclease YafQ of YafQ-DinJ toxin-antitoxin module
MEIYYSSEFKKRFKKLPSQIKAIAIDKEHFFRTNPFNPSLRTHKLAGRLHGLWSFSLDYKHRIIFRFLPDRTVLFISVGDHSIYR